MEIVNYPDLVGWARQLVDNFLREVLTRYGHQPIETAALVRLMFEVRDHIPVYTFLITFEAVDSQAVNVHLLDGEEVKVVRVIFDDEFAACLRIQAGCFLLFQLRILALHQV